MRSLAPPVLLLAAACASATAQSPYPNRSAAESFVCRPTGLGQFTGKRPTADIARQILTVSGAKVLRWVAPGQMVTMEYSEARVTVYLDAQGLIERAACG